MSRLVGLVAASCFILAGCTRKNPLSCADGTCSDPELPFCDIDGSISGEPRTCIAVQCTPGEFETCRGTSAQTCNASGDDFDLIPCDRGCEDGLGCRLCDPGETACTQGKVATCDASGKATVKETCGFACAAGEARCQSIDASNGIGIYLGQVANPPVIKATNPIFHADDGAVTVGAQTLSIPSFLIPATAAGPAVRVFVVDSLELDGASFASMGNQGPATAVIARRDIILRGVVSIATRLGSGGVGCSAQGGSVSTTAAGGGGGGGNGSLGGRGGFVAPGGPGGTGGATAGSASIVPLRGGCPGGNDPSAAPQLNGGGALQLSTSGALIVDGTVLIAGASGTAEDSGAGLFYDGGGGSGGSLLLEGANVSLSGTTVIDGSGGKGSQACATPGPGCGAAGAGATNTSTVVDAPVVTFSNPFTSGGGGGGGLGRLRVNTKLGTYSKGPTTIEMVVVTSGTSNAR